MNKNRSELKQIVIILLYIIIIAVGVYFNVGEENQTGNVVENKKISYEYRIFQNIVEKYLLK